MVEFALILPVLLLLTLGVIDAARVFTANIALKNGVREAAIFAAQNVESGTKSYDQWCALGGVIPCPTGATAVNQWPDPTNIAYRIYAEASGLDAATIRLDPPVCNGGIAPTCDGSSTTVTITAHYKVAVLVPLLSAIWSGEIGTSTTAQMLR